MTPPQPKERAFRALRREVLEQDGAIRRLMQHRAASGNHRVGGACAHHVRAAPIQRPGKPRTMRRSNNQRSRARGIRARVDRGDLHDRRQDRGNRCAQRCCQSTKQPLGGGARAGQEQCC